MSKLNTVGTSVYSATNSHEPSLTSDHYLKVAFVTSMASKLQEKSLKTYFQGNVRMFFSIHHKQHVVKYTCKRV